MFITLSSKFFDLSQLDTLVNINQKESPETQGIHFNLSQCFSSQKYPYFKKKLFLFINSNKYYVL